MTWAPAWPRAAAHATPSPRPAPVTTQAERQRLAAGVVFGLLLPDQAQELHGLWEEFEAAATPDAKFAKALDRLQPILLNHAAGGGTWTDYAVDKDGPGPRYCANSPARWSNKARMRRVARRSSCMTSQMPTRASTRPGSTGKSSELRRPTPSWQ